MFEPLTPAELKALRALNTPTVANAIERFDQRARHLGFMGPEVRCIFPEMPPIVGYAATARIMAEQPAAGTWAPSRHEYWDAILSVPAPRIAVIQDLDQPAAIGSFWGEVNGNIHRALGCAGTITNGGVRDLDEVHALGFQMFASAVIVSHAYVHLVEYGTPVKVGGLVVRPGDLIHADKHGAIVIPHEIARDVPAAAAEVERMERRIINYCQSPEFDVAGLKELTR
jgi:4-hydroxy-4-methyl-2-oxoglutarate aldolase